MSEDRDGDSTLGDAGRGSNEVEFAEGRRQETEVLSNEVASSLALALQSSNAQ